MLYIQKIHSQLQTQMRSTKFPTPNYHQFIRFEQMELVKLRIIDENKNISHLLQFSYQNTIK